jgi:hypothetical protein
VAIYRPAKPRWRTAALAGVGGLAVGVLVGLVVGSNEPDPEAAAQSIRSDMQAAASTLDIVPIEYDEGVEDGEVVSEREYGAARDAVQRSREQFQPATDVLSLFATDVVGDIEAGYNDLVEAIDAVEDPDDVERRAEALADLLTGVEG